MEGHALDAKWIPEILLHVGFKRHIIYPPAQSRLVPYAQLLPGSKIGGVEIASIIGVFDVICCP
jgi:hypothetical protein